MLDYQILQYPGPIHNACCQLIEAGCRKHGPEVFAAMGHVRSGQHKFQLWFGHRTHETLDKIDFHAIDIKIPQGQRPGKTVKFTDFGLADSRAPVLPEPTP